MNNPLSLPVSCIADQDVPKNAFYKRALPGRVAPLRQKLTDEVARIVWLYRLHPDTINLPAGKAVSEIDIFLIEQKHNDFPLTLLTDLDNLIPRPTLFLLRYDNWVRLAMRYKEFRGNDNYRPFDRIECTELLPLTDLRLPLVGQDLDALYATILGTLSGWHITTLHEYRRAAECKTKIEMLQREIDALENKIRNEKQFSLQFELNQQRNKLRRSIEQLKALLPEPQ